MISIPSTDSLLPRIHSFGNGGRIYAFPSTTTDLVKLDLSYEAGSAYQSQPLCAAAANHLYSVASASMDAMQMAEFMDYRGIVLQHNPDTLTATTTMYFLRRYADELLPVLWELLHSPVFPEADLDAFRVRRRQKILAARQKSGDEARRLFYQTLCGPEHPLGRYAAPEDADRLSRDVVASYFSDRYVAPLVVAAGNLDAGLLHSLESLADDGVAKDRIDCLVQESVMAHAAAKAGMTVTAPIAGAVQTTIRVGRLLPLMWDDAEYADLMILVTLLGGYFGSRLMSNLRETKGYTYGVAARTQIFRGAIVFYISTDVAAGTASDAIEQIRYELKRLADEAVSEDELRLVCNVLAGDFLRSVDGVFEHSERFVHMMGTGVDERLTDHLREALSTVTPSRLQAVAAKFLAPETMLYCLAGAV